MKTNQLLGVIGGLLLIAVTIIPLGDRGVMWQTVGFISYFPLVGLWPVILTACGAIGLLMAKNNKGMVALACGAAALLYSLIVAEFNFAMFKDVIGIMLLLGCLLLIASGAMKSK